MHDLNFLADSTRRPLLALIVDCRDAMPRRQRDQQIAAAVKEWVATQKRATEKCSNAESPALP
jgi:hypothetical protein